VIDLWQEKRKEGIKRGRFNKGGERITERNEGWVRREKDSRTRKAYASAEKALPCAKPGISVGIVRSELVRCGAKYGRAQLVYKNQSLKKKGGGKGFRNEKKK